ncbi:MAG: hypothetical protein U1E45_04530 [Geminicoccaceae bacterium]
MPERQRMCFLGVSTGGSAIRSIFPRWCEALGIDADLVGIDLPLNAERDAYRDFVRGLRADPSAHGALITTHKVALHEATDDLLDEITPIAARLGEISCLYKRGDTLVGDALDPVSAGLTLSALLPAGHWTRTQAQALVLGAGGAALAIIAALQGSANAPAVISVTDVSPERLAALSGCFRDVRGRLVQDATATDALLEALPPGSLVVNATGMGKDRRGSPLSDTAKFPEDAVVWELNYRGGLDFLHQARRQQSAQRLVIEDGWTYFLHGWTRHIAKVFDRDIPSAGPGFEALDRIARQVTGRP